MSDTIGIDLGTTNSCVAIMERGRATVISNAEGSRTTPSVVAFLDEGEIVGETARRQLVMNPERTISSIKRFMGKRVSECVEEAEAVSYEIVENANTDLRVQVGENLFSPEELSSKLISKLKNDAEAYLGNPVTRAVVTVPAYFNDAQRQATRTAAELAGLEVLRLVNEPTAASLAYGFGHGREEIILVFDLGGGTFDVSVLELGDGVYEVLATFGDNHLGGDDFDQAIVEWIAKCFKEEHKIDLLEQGEDTRRRLFEAAEQAKIELSSLPKARISLPYIATVDTKPLHLDMELHRENLNMICLDLLERLDEPTRKALDAVWDKTGQKIDHVVLVGGMTRMPAVRERVAGLTGCNPRGGVNPDEAVAIGAAIQASSIVGETDEVLLLDVTPLSLGIETKGGVMTKLIEANTTIPVRVPEVFTTSQDNQASVEVRILQGERALARDNRVLGRIQLLGIPPAPKGVPQIEVAFDLNADGILNVTAVDLGTGNQQQLEIKGAGGLDDEEIQRIKERAKQLQTEDDQILKEVKSRNAAEALATQVDTHLHEHGDTLNPDELESVEAALAELNSALATGEYLEIEQAKQNLTDAFQSFTVRLYGEPPAMPDADEAILEPADETLETASWENGSDVEDPEEMLDRDGPVDDPDVDEL